MELLLIIGLIMFFVGIGIIFFSVSKNGTNVGVVMLFIGAILSTFSRFYLIGTADIPDWLKYLLLS